MLLLYIISTHTEEEMEELDNEMIVAKAKQKSQTSLEIFTYTTSKYASEMFWSLFSHFTTSNLV